MELYDPSPDPAVAAVHQTARKSRTAIVWWLVLIIVWVVCALYVLHYLPRGWVPHDEGTLGQSAERVLHGQLPHRDFAEVYSGGLSFLNAAAFRVLGVNLLTLRLVLYAAFLLWVPAVYYIATRFVAPVGAGAVVLLAAAWSLPNYSAAMPSWYNLFLATFGVAAVLRYIDVGRGRWLVLAGVCGGLSCIVKIVGVYYIGAVLLLVVYREQDLSQEDGRGQRRRTWSYSLSISAALLAFVATLLTLLRRQLGAAEFVHFLVPAALLAGLLLRREWRQLPTVDGAYRFRVLARMAVPFCLGVLLPVALFLIPYLRADAIGALIQGVFITPMKRMAFAAVHPPGIVRLLPSVLLFPLAGLVAIRPSHPSWITKSAIGLGLAAVVYASGTSATLYIIAWDSMRGLPPLIVLCGGWLLTRHGAGLPMARRQQILLLLAVTALCGLVQFPFAAPVYFFYVAPLVALAALAVITNWPGLRMLGPTAILAFFLAFAMVRIHPGFIYRMGHSFSRVDNSTSLVLDRGGIDVSVSDTAVYQQLVRTIREHASGPYIFVTPDAPQVYFLSGLANPTRTIYDFFDNQDGREQRILSALETHHINVVTINRRPEFSGPVSPALESELVASYPYSAAVGQFVVRWRE